MQFLSRPQHWQWLGSCLPEQLQPLQNHPMRDWMLSPGNHHSPPQRELFLALEGTTVYPFKGEVYPIKPGTVCLFDHHEMHGLAPIPGEHSFSHLWLHLPNRNLMSSNLYGVSEAGTLIKVSFRVQSDPFVQLVYDAWSTLAAEPESGIKRFFFQSVLTTAFLELLGRPILEPPKELEKSVVDYIADYIEEHLSEPLTLERLAQFAGYNPHAFHRIFRHHRRITLHRYVIARRITKAQQLLQQGWTLESIAEAVGLSSSAVFSRFFKKWVKLSPSRWREKNRYEIN